MSPDCLEQLEISHPSASVPDDGVTFASQDNSVPMALTLTMVTRMTCLLLLATLLFASGCAAMKPMQGIPARYMPDEFKPSSRSGKKTINLSLLRQSPPPQYLLDAGDVLAIYIEGVLGDRKQVPPVHFPQNREVPPSFGFPVPVRDDGTISLPMSRPIDVRGMTVGQVEEKIRKRLTLEKQVLKPGRERILVSLQRPRSYQVLVIRQEAGVTDVTQGGQGTVNPGVLKRGVGRTVALPAYQNDVLHALAQTGGLPGLDAENVIYIIRNQKNKSHGNRQMNPCGNGCFPQSRNEVHQRSQQIQQVSSVTVSQYQPPQIPLSPQFGGHSAVPATDRMQYLQPTPVSMYPTSGHSTMQGEMNRQSQRASSSSNDPTVESEEITRIPVRLAAGDYPQFSEQDIILEDGDIIFIETRETEIFYTGGLLGGGQYTLPRDYDLDILGAISIAESSQNGGGGNSGGGRQTGGVSALNQDVTIGASNVIILRKLPNGKQVPIKIDLYKAIRNPEERILVQPGDYVMLQYTKWEATWAFAERHLLEGALFGLATSQFLTNDNN